MPDLDNIKGVSGEDIRKILKVNKIVLTDVAEAMKITPQNLNSKLKAKDIGTGFLAELSKATGISVNTFIEGENAETVTNEANTNYNTQSLTEKYIACLEEKNKLQEKIIEMQELLLKFQNHPFDSKK